MLNSGEIFLRDLLKDELDSTSTETKEVIRRLNKAGWTVYRKRVMINPPRRAKSQPVTPKLVKQIQHLHKTTNMTQQQIANALGVNSGRVNEVLHG